MFLIIPKHTHLCYKMAIFNNFDYFVILPFPIISLSPQSSFSTHTTAANEEEGH